MLTNFTPIGYNVFQVDLLLFTIFGGDVVLGVH